MKTTRYVSTWLFCYSALRCWKKEKFRIQTHMVQIWTNYWKFPGQSFQTRTPKHPRNYVGRTRTAARPEVTKSRRLDHRAATPPPTAGAAPACSHRLPDPPLSAHARRMAASYFNHSSYPPAPPPPPGTSSYGAYRSAYPPAPAPPTAYGAYYDRAEQALPSRDELRTLFIAGLPADAKPREVYNLFRDFPGYVSSHLRPGKSSKVLPLPLVEPLGMLHC